MKDQQSQFHDAAQLQQQLRHKNEQLQETSTALEQKCRNLEAFIAESKGSENARLEVIVAAAVASHA
jgi:uncharacterized protein YlxW (UPF0749 family)